MEIITTIIIIMIIIIIIIIIVTGALGAIKKGLEKYVDKIPGINEF